MPRENLGPWMRLYSDVVERKAHYNDRQFRALIEIFVMAMRSPTWGHLPSRRALEAIHGKATIAFLFEQGDVVVTDDNGVTTVEVVGWTHYQAKPVDKTNAERQARFRERKRSNNGSVTPVTSSSSSSNGDARARQIVDERDWTDEQRKAAYIAAQSKQTGVRE